MSKPNRGDWCAGGDTYQPTHTVVSQKRAPKARKIRCPKCNRYLTQKLYLCGDHNCWHLKVPAHKEKK